MSWNDEEYRKAVEQRQQMRGTISNDAVRMAKQATGYCDCGCDEGRQARRQLREEMRGDERLDRERDEDR